MDKKAQRHADPADIVRKALQLHREGKISDASRDRAENVFLRRVETALNRVAPLPPNRERR